MIRIKASEQAEKISIIFGLIVLLVAVAIAWYQGLLADLYADYPARLPLETHQTNERIKIIAHRGDAKSAPENTLESYRAAIAREIDYIEVDVRLTADGVPVAIHDATVDRTTDGEGRISDLSYAELQQLDAGSWFSSRFAGVTIPTLAEVLAEAQGKVCVFIDLKDRVNYQLIKTLKNYAQSSESGCLLVSIVMPSDYKRTFGEGQQQNAELLARLEKIKWRRTQLYNQQISHFKRYWPEAPLTVSYNEGKDLDVLLGEYPGVVAVLAPIYITREIVEKLHARGLYVYTRVSMNTETYSNERLDVIYSQQMESAIDFIFPAEPFGFAAFQETYLSEAPTD